MAEYPRRFSYEWRNGKIPLFIPSVSQELDADNFQIGTISEAGARGQATAGYGISNFTGETRLESADLELHSESSR